MTDAALPADAPAAALPRVGFRRYVLALLMIAYTLSFLDRQMLSILVEPIEKDLHVSDTEMGVLTGPVFVIFYTFLGIPIAWLADRWSRPAIVAIALAVWSGFTALCGLAGGFATLAFARLGVGFGEAGCNPSAHSLIADISTPERRASGLSVYSLGVPIGTLLGLAVGGLIADVGPHGWRVAFLAAAAPGIVLALIVALTVREPRSSRLDASGLAQAVVQPVHDLVDTIRALSGKPTFWFMALASGFSAFVGYAHLFFNASFFLRCHPAEIAAIAATFGLKSKGFLGPALGLMIGVGGFSGTLIGGWIADRAAVRDRRLFATVPGVAAIVVVPLYFVLFTIPNTLVALALVFIPSVISTIWYGAVYSTAQSVVAPHRRATAAALLLLILNLIGLGGGPPFLGAVSDFLAKSEHMGAAEGLRWAMIITGCFSVVAGGFFLAARGRMQADVVS